VLRVVNSLSSKRVWWWAIFSLPYKDKFFDKRDRERQRQNREIDREKGRGFCKVALLVSHFAHLIYSEQRNRIEELV